MSYRGPGSHFELLWEAESTGGQGLPEELKDIYRGDWLVPESSGRPYSYSNFVLSHDGRVSFSTPGHEGGGDVSDFNPHDQWVMALARARADAVVVGANTLRTEFEHQWTAEFIFPSDGEAFAALRASENRKPTPLQVIVTGSGKLNPEATIFRDPRFRVLIATTDSGLENAKAYDLPNLEIVTFGQEVDLTLLYQALSRDYGCKTVLCEGGPRLYASLIGANLLDEEFLTLSPVIVGSSDIDKRPGLIEGLALAPGNDKRANLASVRRAGNHLFLRTTWT